jgi:hypothetical protein
VAFADAVDRYCADVESGGAKIECRPADQQHGMRDFVVSDLDGNLLTFGCPLAETKVG